MTTVICEEYGATSMLLHRLAHVVLTDERLALSTWFWNLRDVPVAAIQAVHFYQDWLGNEVTVEYLGDDGLSHAVRWTTRHDGAWKRAFALVGVKQSI